jgi:membrane fusion protein, multidrug efflux system
MANDTPDDNSRTDEQAAASADTPAPLTAKSDLREKHPDSVGQQHQGKLHRSRIWIALTALVVFGLLLLNHFTKAPPQPAGAPGQQGNAAVTVGEARSGDMGVYVTALGTVTPTYTVTVYSQVTGRVVDVHYREGQMVRKGDALIDIDARPYEATLKQAQGVLLRDQAQLAQAKMDLQRYKNAQARNAIAKQQLDDQIQTVAQLEGTVRSDQGTVAYDQVQLEYCHIVSPIAGRVGLRLVDPGNTVFAGSGATLIVITQLQPITVVFNVAEDDLPRVQAQLTGDNKLPVDVFDRANDHLIESGTLTSLDNQVDTTTGTVRFRAELPNKDLVLFPNQFVNARLLVQTLKNVALVPTPSIRHNGTNDFVYVVNPDNTVTVRTVTTVTSNEEETAVKGLNPGVKIATSGFDRLENGVRVTVRTPGQAPVASAGAASASSQ